MKTYHGTRTGDGCVVTIRLPGAARERALPPRRDLRNHSPDGFEWGYAGSGPSQLALALCADVLGDDERAQRVYQTVKVKLVAPIEGAHWTLTEDRLREAIAEAEAE